jgi:hypothetical protein
MTSERKLRMDAPFRHFVAGGLYVPEHRPSSENRPKTNQHRRPLLVDQSSRRPDADLTCLV